jgi:hypothetical protein
MKYGLVSITKTSRTFLNFAHPFEANACLNNSLSTSKKTQSVSIRKLDWLMLFKEMIAVYSENHMKPVYEKFRITDW